MRIIFGDSFKDISEKELQISRKDVIRTVTNPLRKQRILCDGLEILLFLQKEKESESYLLVIGRHQDDAFHVGSSCFKILPNLLEVAMSDEPVVLLQQLAISFGVPIKVGDHVGKFFFREKIPVPKDFKALDLMGLLIPKEGGGGIASTYFRLTKDGFAEFALVFSIQLSAYLSWLKGKTILHVSAKTYDLFISYKRNTAKDFAQHLKTSLTAEGYRAFIDLDIPQEFSCSERWFDIRDEAIRNSKRFLLIMTVGIETSEEISKELTLARKVPEMKFMYLRHEDLRPKIAIRSTDGETINLDEGNQISFGTAEDLARKVLRNLS